MYVNWLDLLIGGILLFSFIGAVKNGFTREVIRLVALLLGLVGAMWGYEYLAPIYAPWIESEPMQSFAAFGTILFGCLIVGAVLAWAVGKVLGWSGLRWFDRLLGAGFGLARGLLVAAAIVLALVAFTPFDGTEEVVADSRLAPWVIFGAHAAAELAPASLESSYDAGFERVRSVWTSANPYSVVKN